MTQPKIKVRKITADAPKEPVEPNLRPIPLADETFFDHAEIITVERFKTSGISGDEWRFLYKIVLKRKGVEVATRDVGELRIAGILLAQALAMGYGDVEHDHMWNVLPWAEVPRDEYCCQPGCCSLATLTFVLKRRYYDGNLLSLPNLPDEIGTVACRVFCQRHRHRGDSDLEDCDANYLLARRVKRGYDKSVTVMKTVPIESIIAQIRAGE